MQGKPTASALQITTPVRTFEITATVTGYLEGTLDDWPPQVQDAAYEALERKAKEVELPLAITASVCTIDHDVPDGQVGRFYVRIVASEIVALDDRITTPPGARIQ